MKGYIPIELSDKKGDSFLLELGVKNTSCKGGENNDTGNDEDKIKNS